LKAQTVRGRIIDIATNEAIEGASIRLLNTQTGVSSGQDGSFSIEGEGTLEISHVLYKTYQVRASRSFMEIGLTAFIKELPSVEIEGRTERTYNSGYSFSATKVAILNKELPQAISTVTKELIADRQAFQLADAVKIIAGVTPSSFYNQYNIRGISQNEEGQIINGLRTRQFYFIQPLTSNIERVEVLKGPASVTYSSVDPGGSINMVTKKPLAIDRREISLSAGSFSTIR
jgi:iron complex outermembrane receptor protein